MTYVNCLWAQYYVQWGITLLTITQRIQYNCIIMEFEIINIFMGKQDLKQFDFGAKGNRP